MIETGATNDGATGHEVKHPVVKNRYFSRWAVQSAPFGVSARNEKRAPVSMVWVAPWNVLASRELRFDIRILDLVDSIDLPSLV